MSVVVKDSLAQGFEFTCGEWAILDPTDKADWTVVSNTCGQPDQEGSPFASSRRFRSVVGDVRVVDPLTTSVVDGVSTIYFIDEPANYVFSGPPSGADAYPTFRLLVPADIPTLPATSITGVNLTAASSKITITGGTGAVLVAATVDVVEASLTLSNMGGTLGFTHGGTGLTALGTDLQYLRTNAGATAMEWATLPLPTGTVTSVAATAPTAGFSISGSPITSSGTFVFTLADDLAGLEAMSGTGFVVRTAANTYAQRTLQAGTGISISANPAGIAGDPTITNTGVISVNGSAGVITGILTTSNVIGTTNQVAKFTGTNTIGNSQITDNGIGVTVGNATVDVLFNVNGAAGMSINGGTNASYGSGLKFRNDANAHFSIGMKGASFVIAQTSSGNTVWPTPADALLISSSGIVNISNLAGTGTRAVTATSTGDLGTTTLTTGTVTSVNITPPAAGITASGGPITSSGSITLALTNDLAALEGLSSTGIAVRSATDTWLQRTIAAGTGISVGNGNGVSGNPTITNSAPDQTVVLTNGTGISVTGTYPSFTITNTVSAGYTPTGTTNQTLRFSGTNTLQNTSSLLNDGANVSVGATVGGARFRVTGITSQTGMWADGGALTSGDALLTLSGTLTSGFAYGCNTTITVTGGNVIDRTRNAATSGVSNAIHTISVAAGSTGDPYTQYLREGTGYWSIGYDVTDNHFKLDSTATLGTTANNGLRVIANDPMLFGFNMDTPLYAVDINDKARSKIWMNNTTVSATATPGTGAGTSPTVTVVASSGNWIILTVVVGTAPLLNGDLVTVNMPLTFTGNAYPVGSSSSNHTADDWLKFTWIPVSGSQWKIKMNGTASGTYNFNCYVFG